MAKPTANWEKIGNGFYRKIQLYTAVFDEDLELENYLIAGAPYSGAVRDLLQIGHGPADTCSRLPSTEMPIEYNHIVGLAQGSRASISTAAPETLSAA
jgi:hypothetical protein